MKAIRQLVRLIVGLFVAPIKMLIIYLPGEPGFAVRRLYYSARFGRCGRDLRVCPGVHITGMHLIEVGDDVMIRENVIIQTGRQTRQDPAHDGRDVREAGTYRGREKGVVCIGDHSRIAHGAFILGYGGVSIGSKCGIGPGAKVLSETFHYKGRDPRKLYKYSEGAPAEEQCIIQGFVEFKDGAGVASDVIVLPGAVIGQDSWVGPRSVVKLMGTIPDFVIAKGDPARPVFRRLRSTERQPGPDAPLHQEQGAGG